MKKSQSMMTNYEKLYVMRNWNVECQILRSMEMASPMQHLLEICSVTKYRFRAPISEQAQPLNFPMSTFQVGCNWDTSVCISLLSFPGDVSICFANTKSLVFLVGSPFICPDVSLRMENSVWHVLDLRSSLCHDAPGSSLPRSLHNVKESKKCQLLVFNIIKCPEKARRSHNAFNDLASKVAHCHLHKTLLVRQPALTWCMRRGHRV